MKQTEKQYNEEALLSSLRRIYRSRGFRQFKMRKFEEYDLYVKNKDFLQSGNIITFTDTDGKLMALKPDVTLSIVKNNIPLTPGYVEKLYYQENVYRVSPSMGGYKEILQVGLECLGDVDTYTVGEVLTLASRSLGAVSDSYVLCVSHLGLLSLAVDATGIGEDQKPLLLSCVESKNMHGIRSLCREAGVGEEAMLPLLTLMDASGDPLSVKRRLESVLTEEKWKAPLADLFDTLEAADAPSVTVDFSVVGNMSYYNGPVFKGYIKGIPQSVLSGGRYDRLLARTGSASGAVGFALYLDLLETLPRPREAFDLDVLVLYDASVSPADLNREVEKHALGGLSVLAERSIPEKLTYEKIVDMRGAGKTP